MTTGDEHGPTADDVAAWCAEHLGAAFRLDAWQFEVLRAAYPSVFVLVAARIADDVATGDPVRVWAQRIEAALDGRPRRQCTPPRPRSRLLITRAR